MGTHSSILKNFKGLSELQIHMLISQHLALSPKFCCFSCSHFAANSIKQIHKTKVWPALRLGGVAFPWCRERGCQRNASNRARSLSSPFRTWWRGVARCVPSRVSSPCVGDGGISSRMPNKQGRRATWCAHSRWQTSRDG